MATSALPLGTDVSTNDRFARQKLPLTTQNAISALPPNTGHRQHRLARLKSADIVAKVFSGWRTKILRAADALHARRGEGPYRCIQNRPRAPVTALKSDAATE